MFRTLRSKLVFSYAAISLLILALALAVVFVLGAAYTKRISFGALQQKKAIVMPLLESAPADLRGNVRPLLTNRFITIFRNAGVRVLIVDPATMQIKKDTAAKSGATGTVFELPKAAGSAQKLDLGEEVQGTVRLQGEGRPLQYIAQRPGVGPLDQYIVVVAQPEPNLEALLAGARELGLPAALVALLVSMTVAYFLARSLSEPLARLMRAAAAMSQGDYTQRLPVRGHDEMAALTGQFNVMAEEVGRTHRVQRDFVANVSHDLKTPLTSIQGFSQAMLDGSIQDEEQRRLAAGIINNEAQRMSRLVSQLLLLSQLESGLRSIELRACRLGPLLNQLALSMQPQAAAAGVDLLTRSNVDDALVLADADKLKQAFGNLIDNALKHTPPGGAVTLGLAPAQDAVEVTVSDDGEGIPAADLPRVMERFYQVDKVRSSGRTRSLGLGLAITKEIVAAHHGQISLESVQGKGTTVRVRLPATQMEPHEGRRHKKVSRHTASSWAVPNSGTRTKGKTEVTK